MKRNPDLERLILLEAENLPFPPPNTIKNLTIANYSEEEVAYHTLLLWEAGFIEAIDATTMKHHVYGVQRLTMAGHQYLERIRDPEIWKNTKNGAEKVGSFGLDVISALAKGFLKTKISEHTGIKVEL